MSKVLTSNIIPGNKYYRVIHTNECNNVELTRAINNDNSYYTKLIICSNKLYHHLHFNEDDGTVSMIVLVNTITRSVYSTYKVSGNTIAITVNEYSKYYDTINEYLELLNG